MNDTSLYQQILGLSAPWSVSEVKLDVAAQEVVIFVMHDPKAVWHCPVCGKQVGLYDHAEERSWRHLDSCQFKTYLRTRIPRVCCPEHGIHNANLPWGQRGSRFTMMMERLVIDVLQQCHTISGACEILRLSWKEVSTIMSRAVQRGQKRKESKPIRSIGVDEKSFKPGHHYVTIVTDLDKASVEYVTQGRDSLALAGYYQQLSSNERNAIESVAMDMHAPYLKATMQNIPLAEQKIVFDRFHVMKIVNDAMDRVRQRENRELSLRGDTRLNQSRHLWLWGKENLPEKHRVRLNLLKKMDLKIARAWAMKENLRRLWDQSNLSSARRLLTRWKNWVTRSKLAPMINLAKTIMQKKEQILNYVNHPITTGVCEGLNSKIMTIKRKCCGFRNIENFKQAILFYCGKLDLYPR